MRKKDIAERIQQAVGTSQNTAATLVECILSLLKNTLQTGEPIAIQGFGRFTVRSKRARQGRNPKTVKAMVISPRRVVTFQPSHLLRTEVNSVAAEQPDAVMRTQGKGLVPKGKW
jgi:integration host factor subunit alpha